jgi:hypothetical protein
LLKTIKYITLFFLLNGATSIFCESGYSQNDTIFSPFEKSPMWGKFMSMGDFNGNGFNDLVVLAPKVLNNKGKLTGAFSVYYGSENRISKTGELFYGNLASHYNGLSHITSGDFNNDGFDDIIVSNSFYGEPQLDRGFVEIYWGSTKGINRNNHVLKKGESAYGSYGNNLASCDFNNDGIKDLIVEARFDYMLEGRIHIYYGGRTLNLVNPDLSLKVENSQSLYFAFVSDFNNDGVDDIVCRSNANWNANITQIYIFYGGKKAKNYPARSFEIDNFYPNLYFESDSIMLGFYSNIKHQFFTTAIRLNNHGFEKLPIKLEGNSIKTKENNFLIFDKTEKLPLRFFDINDGSIILEDSLQPFPDNTLILQPFLFRRTQTSKQKLILPLQKKGKEVLLFVDIPKP